MTVPSFSRDGYWLYSGDKPIVHLTESNIHFANEKQGYLDHVAFQLTGLRKLVQTLVELDIRYTTASVDEIGMTQVFFKTPSGIGIEANFLNEQLLDG